METMRNGYKEPGGNPADLLAAQSHAIEQEVLKAGAKAKTKGLKATNDGLEHEILAKTWELEQKQAYLQEQKSH